MAAHDTYKTGGRRPFMSQTQYKDGAYAGTLTGDITLGLTTAQFLKLDPGGASRNITIGADLGWAEVPFTIVNAADAAEDLVVLDKDGATVVTISQNERCTVIGDGDSSIVHLGIESIALS